jgi:hypothetical protein
MNTDMIKERDIELMDYVSPKAQISTPQSSYQSGLPLDHDFIWISMGINNEYNVRKALFYRVFHMFLMFKICCQNNKSAIGI